MVGSALYWRSWGKGKGQEERGEERKDDGGRWRGGGQIDGEGGGGGMDQMLSVSTVLSQVCEAQ
jgi:hypothetical protein